MQYRMKLTDDEMKFNFFAEQKVTIASAWK